MKFISFALSFLFLCATGTTAQTPCSDVPDVIGTAKASTDILWPPNGKFREVQVTHGSYKVELTAVFQDEDPAAGPRRKNLIEQMFDAIAIFFDNFFRGFGNLFGFGDNGGGNGNNPGNGNNCPGNSCNNPGNGNNCPGNSCKNPGKGKKDLDDEDYGDDYDDIAVTPIDAGLDPDDTSKAYLRSERLGNGDGRIYKLEFDVTYGEDVDGNALTCSGSVDVCVPKSRGVGNNKTPCVDSAPLSYPSF